MRANNLGGVFKIGVNNKRLVTFTFCGVGLFHLWGLMRWPAPHVDEAWLISRSWAYLHTRRVFGMLDRGVFDQFEGYWTFFPWFHTWVTSISLRIVGAPELVGIRLVSLLFGFLLLAAIYWMMKSLGGLHLAIVSVLLIAFSHSFGYSSHIGRYDIVAAALGYCALAILMTNYQRRWWASLISGLLIGLAIETHPNSIVFLPAIFALFLIQRGWYFLRDKDFWFLFLGGLLGGLFYLSLHVFQFPQTYQSIMNILFGEYHKPPILTFDLGIIFQSIRDSLQYFFIRYFLALLIIPWALWRMWKKNQLSERIIAGVTIALFLAYSLLISNKFSYYEIYIAPFLNISLAWFILDYLREPKARSIINSAKFIYIFTAVFSLVIINNSYIVNNTQPKYEAAQNRINQSIEKSDVILGSQTFWLGLTDHKYFSGEQLSYNKWFDPEISLAESFKQFKPDILLIDSHMRYFISDDTTNAPYAGLITISKTELEAFLNSNATLVDEFTNEEYGLISIYRLHGLTPEN